MEKAIYWLLANFFTWMAAVGLVQGLLTNTQSRSRYDNVLRCLFLWYVGLAFTFSGVMHIFLGDLTAKQIGWANSPFQFEIGLANWSIAILGFFSFFNTNRSVWLVSILALIIQSTGAGFGHVYQLLVNNNHAVSNAGLIMYTDLFVPLIMLGIWFKAEATTRNS